MPKLGQVLDRIVLGNAVQVHLDLKIQGTVDGKEVLRSGGAGSFHLKAWNGVKHFRERVRVQRLNIFGSDNGNVFSNLRGGTRGSGSGEDGGRRTSYKSEILKLFIWRSPKGNCPYESEEQQKQQTLWNQEVLQKSNSLTEKLSKEKGVYDEGSYHNPQEKVQ